MHCLVNCVGKCVVNCIASCVSNCVRDCTSHCTAHCSRGCTRHYSRRRSGRCSSHFPGKRTGDCANQCIGHCIGEGYPLHGLRAEGWAAELWLRAERHTIRCGYSTSQLASNSVVSGGRPLFSADQTLAEQRGQRRLRLWLTPVRRSPLPDSGTGTGCHDR